MGIYTDMKRIKKGVFGISPAVQWLVLCASIAGTRGSIPGGETKIPHAAWYNQKRGGSCFRSFFFFFCPFATTHVGMEDKSLLLCSPLEEVK